MLLTWTKRDDFAQQSSKNEITSAAALFNSFSTAVASLLVDASGKDMSYDLQETSPLQDCRKWVSSSGNYPKRKKYCTCYR
ncbi:hypothetical protein NPIL_73591 [Nephila pilipes]|uniref:Uncharacterized protein n=1 Tax=Nephila pilipes TaxID=299642 RepID=A0A8X6NXX9_NEPPI|nr:hypothetical protein NPIL_73591 [Nephila pilipes]